MGHPVWRNRAISGLYLVSCPVLFMQRACHYSLFSSNKWTERNIRKLSTKCRSSEMRVACHPLLKNVVKKYSWRETVSTSGCITGSRCHVVVVMWRFMVSCICWHWQYPSGYHSLMTPADRNIHQNRFQPPPPARDAVAVRSSVILDALTRVVARTVSETILSPQCRQLCTFSIFSGIHR